MSGGVHHKLKGLPVSDSESTSTEGAGGTLQYFSLKIFCYDELKKATRNFRYATAVGFGSSNTVFKGCIDVHSLKATKACLTRKRGCGCRIVINDRIQLPWTAYSPKSCKSDWLLFREKYRTLGVQIYDLRQLGNTSTYKIGDSQSQPLSWNLRMKIAVSAAKGLAFLHSDKAKMIYGDFKSSNILLDSGDELDRSYRRLRCHDTECSLDSRMQLLSILWTQREENMRYRFESSDDDENGIFFITTSSLLLRK